MAINLELPQKLAPVTEQAHLAAEHIFRPISRTYDKAEHTYPQELDELGKLVVAKVQTLDGITRTLTCPVVHI